MASGLNTYHGIRDGEKLAELEASMAVNGWVGAPVVVDGYEALTGSHRIVAAERVLERWEQGADVKEVRIPTIDIRDVWTEAGINESIDDYLLYETVDEYVVICDMIRDAAPDLADSYGLDLH